MPVKDPPVITFDGESLSNALLYGSDEFNNKINKKNTSLHYTKQGRQHSSGRGGREGGMSPLFLCSKNKKRKQRGEKERVSKQELLKGSHQSLNVSVSVMITVLF